MKWTTIRTLGEVKYFNVCYIVLLGVPALAEAYIHVHQLGAYPKFPPPLKWLYLASICYAIGIAIYQYFCPPVIKMYERDIDYLQAEKEVHLNSRPDRKIELILTNLIDDQKDTLDELLMLNKNKNLNLTQREKLQSLIDSHYPSCIQRYILGEYARLNTTHPRLIFTSGLFYFLGTSIMLCLLIAKSWKVFNI